MPSGPFGNLNDKYDALFLEVQRIAEAAEKFEFPKSDQQHSPGYREWERFNLVDGGQCDGSGNLTVGGGDSRLRITNAGWEAYLTSVAVTVSGASSAATVTNYVGGVADPNLLDYANQMLGNSPSRIVGFYDKETVYFYSNQALTVVIAGAVASANVTVRAAGKRRQV